MDTDLNKLKVPELRKELQSRGLDSKGNKPVLIERLREALEKENAGGDEGENEEVTSSEENSLMYTTAESEKDIPPSTQTNDDERPFSVITSAVPIETEQDTTSAEIDEQLNMTEQTEITKLSTDDDAMIENASTQETYDSDSLQETYDSENTVAEQVSEQQDAATDLDDQSTIVYEQSNYNDQSYGSSSPQATTETESAIKSQEEVRNVNEETMDVVESDAVSKKDELFEESKNTFSNQNFSSHEVTEIQHESKEETTDKQDGEEEQMDVQENIEEPRKRIRKSRFNQPDEVGNEFEQSEEGVTNRSDENRKRKHSPSPSGNGGMWGSYDSAPKIAKEDDEPSFDDEALLLSWYDSDLNLIISKENFTTAEPLNDAFVNMWAGARGTYGFQSGKVYYDVKLLKKILMSAVEDYEMLYSFRIGWSIAGSSLQLGEVPLSYGYDSSGKKCLDDNFEDYGESYDVEDVVGCLVDFDSNEENVLITFTKNGVSQGVAFEVSKELLGDKALFPHFLSKNISFEVNFGEREDNWNLEQKFEEEFTWASKVPLENRAKGPRKPEEKKQCEIVMMCGLPCSGKTTWVKKHVEEFPEKMYNVIGIDSVLKKMKILNEPIEKIFKEKEENMNTLVERCTKGMNLIFEIACTRWRNYILDQSNIFLTVQRRKMRSFQGFTRLAVVTIPKEEDYEKYFEKWDENPVRDTSISLLELKSNFRLPEEGELFDTVVFEGSTREEALELIRKYNKEGRDARQRDDRGFNRGFHREDRYGGRPMPGGYRSRWMDRGPPMGRGGWAPRMGGPGGFRERRGWRDRMDDRDGGFRGGRYGGPRDQGRFGGGAMMGGNRWGGRDRPPRGPGGPGSGPNPLMGSLVGKPGGPGPMGFGERKSRFEDKRDNEDFEHSGRVGPPGVEEGDETVDKGNTNSGDDDRRRYSRFSDGPGGGGFRGGRGGFRGRGGGGPERGGGRFGGNFRPNNGAGPRGGGGNAGFNRNRDDSSGGRFYGGRGGGPPGRDSRDNRNPMNNQQRSSGGMNNRFEKRDSNNTSGNKNDSNPSNQQQQQQQSGWNAYGQQQANNWNQFPWAQYQQAGYNPQQIQQFWSQMQQQSQNAGSASQVSQQSSKAGASAVANTTNSASTTAQSSTVSNTSTTQQSGTNAGYTTQGYNTQGYNAQGYNQNAYAQYCAYYSQLAAQQGWPQNADGSYSYPANAWAAQYANYNYNTAAAAGSAGANTGSSNPAGSSNVNSAATSK